MFADIVKTALSVINCGMIRAFLYWDGCHISLFPPPLSYIAHLEKLGLSNASSSELHIRRKGKRS